jgi:thiol-disulfide isomerase/thioredoxin
MKKQDKTPQPFLKKHWSNILFVVLLIVLLVPQTRAYFQAWVVLPIIGSPEILEETENQKLADYNLILNDLNDHRVNLSQSKGKPMLINFWATWCSPCIAEMPGLVELHEEFGDEVDFYFISNEEKALLQKFLKLKTYDIPVYNPVSKIPTYYNTNAIPSTYLIDGDGNMIAKAEGMANWDSDKVKETIRKLLN